MLLKPLMLLLALGLSSSALANGPEKFEPGKAETLDITAYVIGEKDLYRADDCWQRATRHEGCTFTDADGNLLTPEQLEAIEPAAGTAKESEAQNDMD